MEIVEMETEETENSCVSQRFLEEDSRHSLGRTRIPKGKQTTQDELRGLTLQLQEPSGS